ncbi:MAG: hypothetical protein HZC10_00105 [Nitrospirae bacterium]|nr:hypothetical protein [Nitrospirota bacterium]
MGKAAKSIFVWGIYLVAIGSLLLLIPNFMLSLFGFQATNEVWIRVLGGVVVALGYYHIQAARHGLFPFFRWSTQGRAFTVVCFFAFVALGLAKPTLLLFASADFLGALWTGMILRASQATG